MAEKTLKTRIIQKHDTEANWLLATNFTPMNGEIIIYDEDDNHDYKRIKIGNGIDNVNDLDFVVNKEDVPKGVTSWNDLEDKPFGEEIGEFVSVTQMAPIMNTGTLAVLQIPVQSCKFTAGDNYTITLNDTVYNNVATAMNEGVYIGNLLLYAQLEGTPEEAYAEYGIVDTGEPYFILSLSEDSLAVVTSIMANAYDLKITGIIIRKIDDAYVNLIGKTGEGLCSEIFNDYDKNIASGDYSHAEGNNVTASGDYSHAEGMNSKAIGYSSHAEGNNVTASGSCSHAEGGSTVASGSHSHAEGDNTVANGYSSHAEGSGTTSSGNYSHAEGYMTTASGDYSHAEGCGEYSVPDTITNDSTIDEIIDAYNSKKFTLAKGKASHAEGISTLALVDYSHAEGYRTTASGQSSHAEGENTTASGARSHAEGYGTSALDDYDHAEGYKTTASGRFSHAEGSNAIASGESSHAEGYHTIAAGDSQHVQGEYNIEDTENKYAHIVGNGSYNTPSNAHTLDWDGNAWFAGDVQATNTYGRSTSLAVVSESVLGHSTSRNISYAHNGVIGSNDTFIHNGIRYYKITNEIYSVDTIKSVESERYRNKLNDYTTNSSIEIGDNAVYLGYAIMILNEGDFVLYNITATAPSTGIYFRSDLGGLLDDYQTKLDITLLPTVDLTTNAKNIIGAINELNTSISDKANATHTHAISDITDLETTLSNTASAIAANTDSITAHSTAISNLQTAIGEIQEITSAEIQALFSGTGLEIPPGEGDDLPDPVED